MLGMSILYNGCTEEYSITLAFCHLCKATPRCHLQIPESKRIMKGAKARVLYKAMRCHANGEVTIMLVNEIYRTLRLSILEKILELNHTGCNGKE